LPEFIFGAYWNNIKLTCTSRVNVRVPKRRANILGCGKRWIWMQYYMWSNGVKYLASLSGCCITKERNQIPNEDRNINFFVSVPSPESVRLLLLLMFLDLRLKRNVFVCHVIFRIQGVNISRQWAHPRVWHRRLIFALLTLDLFSELTLYFPKMWCMHDQLISSVDYVSKRNSYFSIRG
jgi:hypothetical protein